jgi:predicted enzyme related to lactoylglutathione lyase
VLGLEVAMDLGWIVTYAAPGNLTARAAGHEIVHPLTDEPWGVRRFFVRDPHGKVINVLSHR